MINYKNTTINLLCLACLIAGTVYGQTVNTGNIVVKSATQFSVVDDFTNNSGAEFINDGESFFYSDFTNNGVVDYIAGGLTRMEGMNQQLITSPVPSYFFNLLFNNSSGLEKAIDLSGTIEVTQEVDFTEGIVNTIDNDGLFIIQNGGFVSNTSDLSFVDGFITKEGNSNFTFPIGDAMFYRYAGISSPAFTSALYKSRYVYKDPENPYPAEFRIGNIILMNEDEYWLLDNNQENETLDVTLSWDESKTTPIEIVANPEGIRMARWDFDANAWRDVGGTVDVANRTVTSRQTINGLAVFTIAGADLDIVLPDNVVVWNAVSTIGDGKNDYFFIEGIEKLPNNRLEIYNRWGTLVFKTSDYDTEGNVFRGYAQGRSDTLLPSGTYFYVLTYDSTSSGRVKKAGFLYLSTD
ncbi:gliding motility-associated C-terminal domain-containing protein [Tenacibaculum tangerinum]|uniref:Gliding motility-associated C-terminal domain-containing protein n=1 Tax=Tenacibaculum tangerinum TaxID=3038772 RepID=A0ABY8L4F1_9FLAO|nr:gliding motility-associated C-terminal domain-containing protein [Tenacibaculum tangerinum]WGH75482.1 gliding motility-associated C-terminal domain-containing protein [Tenacibaculum tangerinum]